MSRIDEIVKRLVRPDRVTGWEESDIHYLLSEIHDLKSKLSDCDDKRETVVRMLRESGKRIKHFEELQVLHQEEIKHLKDRG